MKKSVSMICAILTTFIWGTTFVAQTTGMDMIGPLTFNGSRFFIGFLTLIPVALIFEKNRIVKEVNREVAEAIGINPAARTTCVKPSGYASVLLQSGSGIHAEHSSIYIRNVQMNKESEITQAIMKTNPYMVEESVWSAGGTDVVVSFPMLQ